MDNNRVLFHRKWQSDLERKHCHREVPAGAAYRATRGPRILWLGGQVPVPDQDPASARTFEMLRILLVAEYDVTFQPLEAKGASSYKLQLQLYGVDVLPAWDAGVWRQSTQGRCQYDGIIISHSNTFQAVVQQVSAVQPSCIPKQG